MEFADLADESQGMLSLLTEGLGMGIDVEGGNPEEVFKAGFLEEVQVVAFVVRHDEVELLMTGVVGEGSQGCGHVLGVANNQQFGAGELFEVDGEV